MATRTPLRTILLLVPAFLLPAQSPHKLLATSTISYTCDTPPRPSGGSHYRITIKPNHSATIWYLSGPGNAVDFGEGVSIGPLNRTPPSTSTFQLTPAAYQTLLDTLLAHGILATGWPTRQPLVIGGSRQIITIQKPSKEIITLTLPHLTSTSESSPAIRFVKITDALKAVIPDSAWNAIDIEREAYDKAHSP